MNQYLKTIKAQNDCLSHERFEQKFMFGLFSFVFILIIVVYIKKNNNNNKNK